MRSLGVTANGFKKLFDAFVTLFFAESRVCDMLPRVFLDDFLHQAIDGSASSGNKVQCFGAIEVRLQCPLNGLDLSGDAFYAFEKIVFVYRNMTHGIPPLPMHCA
ncbi:hypothetical protein UB23_11490 [Pseudomonas sp. ES3-33]|nr:hypothetical protein UB23_11490 [Pseudomonas sp. ES3-33]